MDKIIELYKENEHGEELVKDIEEYPNKSLIHFLKSYIYFNTF